MSLNKQQRALYIQPSYLVAWNISVKPNSYRPLHLHLETTAPDRNRTSQPCAGPDHRMELEAHRLDLLTLHDHADLTLSKKKCVRS